MHFYPFHLVMYTERYSFVLFQNGLFYISIITSEHMMLGKAWQLVREMSRVQCPKVLTLTMLVIISRQIYRTGRN
jgi:hypothetical protein